MWHYHPCLPRFSPACAGNASWHREEQANQTVQPRVCGERSLENARRVMDHGSAPRVRGTHGETRVTRRCCRFSPACAGNAGCQRGACGTNPVQPRVCGERAPLNGVLHLLNGSAPRVRGTQNEKDPPARASRFSPACAGNAWRCRSRTRKRAVQPRVCGERLRQHQIGGRGRGSAPRVRGTRPAYLRHYATHRFSPACAGNALVVCDTHNGHAVQPRVCGERTSSHPIDLTPFSRCQRTAPT